MVQNASYGPQPGLRWSVARRADSHRPRASAPLRARPSAAAELPWP